MKTETSQEKRQICLAERWVRAAVRTCLLRTGRVFSVWWSWSKPLLDVQGTVWCWRVWDLNQDPSNTSRDFDKIHDRNVGKSGNLWHPDCYWVFGAIMCEMLAWYFTVIFVISALPHIIDSPSQGQRVQWACWVPGGSVCRLLDKTVFSFEMIF